MEEAACSDPQLSSPLSLSPILLLGPLRKQDAVTAATVSVTYLGIYWD
jgi:hypothetical protein